MPQEPSPFSIRCAQHGDEHVLGRLLAGAARQHALALPLLLRVPDERASRKMILHAMREQNSFLFVAVPQMEPDAEAVGFVHFTHRQAGAHSLLAPGTSLHVETLAVAEAHRRQGVGTALMRHVQAWGRANRVGGIELGVYEFNEAARLFYESLGYETLSRRMRRVL